MTGRAVFLDRDGVLNEAILRDGRPYPPAGVEELRLVPDAAQAVAQLKAVGFELIVVTNQPDVARGNQSKAASCSNLCPTAETRVVYGSSIDDAVTEGGKPYSELPNAYRYRDELVKGCTCNGKDLTGLASIRIEDDPTLRKGDIVASGDGLMVAGRGADRRGAALNLSPAPQSIRSHYRRVPVVAAQ